MRSSSSLPLSMPEFYKTKLSLPSGYCLACRLTLRHCDQQAAGRVIEQRGADRALPPACGEGRVLVVAEHDEIDAERLRQAADLLDRLAHREMAGRVEAAVAQRADTLVEHGLRALLFLL